MKKFLSIALIIIICCSSLCGCYTPEPFDVTFEDGTSSKMTTTEIIDLKNTDKKTFDTISMVSGSGKIRDIKIDTMGTKTWNAFDTYYFQLFLQGDVKVIIRLNSDDTFYNQANYQEDIEKFHVGDIITFKSYTTHVFDNRISFSTHFENVVVD